MKRIFIYCILIILGGNCLAQSPTGFTIKGMVTDGQADSAWLIFQKFDFGEPAEIVSAPVQAGNFIFLKKISGPVICELKIGNQFLKLFLEPGYDLSLSFNSSDIVKTVKYEGKGAAENRMYKIFYRQLDDNFGLARMLPNILKMGIDEFEDQLFEEKNNFSSLYKVYPGRTSLSSALLLTLEAEISYGYYHWLLAYPFYKIKSSGNSNISQLPSAMAEIFEEGLFSNDKMLNSQEYREFLSFYIRYKALKENKFLAFPNWTAFVNKQNQVAQENLKGKTYFYWLAKTVYNECDSIKKEVLTPLFQTIKTQDQGGQVYKLITEYCANAANKPATPVLKNPVPTYTKPSAFPFKLTDQDGKQFNLDDFKGKVVYIDFWASWCAPCRMQFSFSKELAKRFSEDERKKLVFLYISIDEAEETWKKTIEQYQLKGIHGRSPGGWQSEVCRYFGLSSIPRYMIMDKRGNIAVEDAPRPSDDRSYEEIIKYLNQ